MALTPKEFCACNSTRSILAESILRKDGGGRFNAYSARCEIGNYGRAYIGTTAAAVLEQEQHDLAEARQIGAVNDGAALPLSLHQARVCEQGPK